MTFVKTGILCGAAAVAAVSGLSGSDALARGGAKDFISQDYQFDGPV